MTRQKREHSGRCCECRRKCSLLCACVYQLGKYTAGMDTRGYKVQGMQFTIGLGGLETMMNRIDDWIAGVYPEDAKVRVWRGRGVCSVAVASFGVYVELAVHGDRTGFSRQSSRTLRRRVCLRAALTWRCKRASTRFCKSVTRCVMSRLVIPVKMIVC